jgi:hypothetical protein
MTTFIVSYETAIIFVMTLAYVIVGEIKFSAKPLDNVFFLIAYAIPISNNVFFFITIINVYWRFNDILEVTRHELKIYEMKLVYKIYNRLNEIVPKINQYYLLNTILALLDLLVITINVAFLVYDTFIHELPLENFILAGGACFYIFLSGTICFLIIEYSSFISSVNCKIKMNLNKIALRRSEVKFYKMCHVGFLQIENTQNKISCGLFNFDWKLIFILMSSFFSYLWTMFQVDLMFNKKNV